MADTNITRWAPLTIIGSLRFLSQCQCFAPQISISTWTPVVSNSQLPKLLHHYNNKELYSVLAPYANYLSKIKEVETLPIGVRSWGTRRLSIWVCLVFFLSGLGSVLTEGSGIWINLRVWSGVWIHLCFYRDKGWLQKWETANSAVVRSHLGWMQQRKIMTPIWEVVSCGVLDF